MVEVEDVATFGEADIDFKASGFSQDFIATSVFLEINFGYIYCIYLDTAHYQDQTYIYYTS